MSDPIRASRLGDLPDAGYATKRQKETSDAIMFFMRGVERDRMLLLAIVVDGVDKWVKTAGNVWRGLLIDRDLLVSIYRYFEAQAGANPAGQLLILHGHQTQAKREAWDKRQSTKVQAEQAMKAALDDLGREQRRLARRKTVS